jgi:predicted nuclease of predicted toxin-antitoxin system
MKLLLDQNLSYRLITSLKDIFPEVTHVTELSLEKASDEDIWKYAKENNFVIVTKDSDFNDLAVLKGSLPKIIWIQKGNCSTDDIIKLLTESYQSLVEFVDDKQNSVLMIP